MNQEAAYHTATKRIQRSLKDAPAAFYLEVHTGNVGAQKRLYNQVALPEKTRVCLHGGLPVDVFFSDGVPIFTASQIRFTVPRAERDWFHDLMSAIAAAGEEEDISSHLERLQSAHYVRVHI